MTVKLGWLEKRAEFKFGSDFHTNLRYKRKISFKSTLITKRLRYFKKKASILAATNLFSSLTWAQKNVLKKVCPRARLWISFCERFSHFIGLKSLILCCGAWWNRSLVAQEIHRKRTSRTIQCTVWYAQKIFRCLPKDNVEKRQNLWNS